MNLFRRTKSWNEETTSLDLPALFLPLTDQRGVTGSFAVFQSRLKGLLELVGVVGRPIEVWLLVEQRLEGYLGLLGRVGDDYGLGVEELAHSGR